MCFWGGRHLPLEMMWMVPENVNKLGVRRCVDAPGDNLQKW